MENVDRPVNNVKLESELWAGTVDTACYRLTGTQFAVSVQPNGHTQVDILSLDEPDIVSVNSPFVPLLLQ